MGVLQAGAGAAEFGIGLGKLDAKSRRLGVDGVRAADGQRVPVLKGTAFQGVQEGVEIGDQQIGGAH